MRKALLFLLIFSVASLQARWLDPQGKPIPSFSILTPNPDYDPVRALAGTLIGERLRDFGLPAQTKPLPFGTIVEKMNERDFDLFILGWSLSLDPDYVRQFFVSKQDVKDGYNAVGYHSASFDALAEKSAKECSKPERKKLIFRAQEMLMHDLPYIPLYFRNELEAYNRTTFSGWFEDLGGISGSMVFLKPLKSPQQFLKIGVQDEPKTLNIFNAQDVWTSHVVGWFYEPLFTREPISHNIVPWIAKDYPKFQGRVATVPLKKGVLWDDGTELTSADVQFTAQLILTLQIPRFLSSYEFIQKVEAPDPYTLVYTLKEHCTPLFLEDTMLNLIVEKKKWEPIVRKLFRGDLQRFYRGDLSPKDRQEILTGLLQYPVKHPESNGPFLFDQWDKGGFVRLKKNPHYFFQGALLRGKKVGPTYAGLLFKIYRNTSTAILALKKGTIDYFWWPLQPESVQELKKTPQLAVANSPGNGFFYLGFNLRKKPFSDLAFRQAVALLIDKEAIVQKGLKGYGEAAYSVVPPANRFWFNSHTEKLGSRLSENDRKKRARQILQAAGYREVRTPSHHSSMRVLALFLISCLLILFLLTRRKRG